MKRIKLIKPHTINGFTHDPGQLLDVTESTAAWLVRVGTAHLVDETPAAPTEEKEEE